MVEVGSRPSEIRFSFRKILIALLVMALLSLVPCWIIVGHRWGVTNSSAEWFRKYLVVINQYRPSVKQVDNLKSALRIHGLESIGGKRHALIFSLTDQNGDPISNISLHGISLQISSSGQASQTASVERVTPIYKMDPWGNDKISFSNIMDYSGSMFSSDLKNTEANYSAFVSDLLMPFSASVIKFDHRIEEALPLSANKTDVINAVSKQLSLGGGTYLYDAMDRGVGHIQTRPHFRFLLLTTDGNSASDQVTIDQILQKCRQQCISVFALGFGWLDETVLARIADDTDGYFSYVPDSGEMKIWFKKLANIVNNV